MNLICKLTDKSLLGTGGWADAEPRYTARTILKNSDGLYAVIYSGKFELYSLPGGGIEENEDRITALKREILEETGCKCNTIAELGYIYENRAHCNYTQYSYYYAVETDGISQSISLTADERNNKTELQWHTLTDVYQLISNVQPKTKQQIFLRARDIAALDYYLKTIK